MSFSAGSCYRNTNSPPPPQHYWFVLSDPTINPDCVFVANITSWNEFTGDGACRLRIGCHPCITKDCFVNYEDARSFAVSDLAVWLQQGLITLHEHASEELLQFMQHGAIESEFCKNKFKKLLAAQGLPRIESN